MRMDRTIIEGLQDIVSVLEDHLKPLVQAELSVLVDTLYRPEMIFPKGTEARRKCENGGFIRRLITHTSNLLGEKEDGLCVKILETLRVMMEVDVEHGEKVILKNTVTVCKKNITDIHLQATERKNGIICLNIHCVS